VASNGTRSTFFDPGQVNFLLLGSGQIRSVIFGLGLWVWKISPIIPNFSPLNQKNLFGLGQTVPRSKAGRPLIC